MNTEYIFKYTIIIVISLVVLALVVLLFNQLIAGILSILAMIVFGIGVIISIIKD